MWKSIYDEVPANNQIVWIRVNGIYGQLAQAQYKRTQQTFTTVVTNVVIPVYFVSRWRAL